MGEAPPPLRHAWGRLSLSTARERLKVRIMNAVSHDHLRHAVDLVFFEQWLRFYFIVEEWGKLYIRMPDSELDNARNLYPELIAVAEVLNNHEIEHQAAMEALCESMLAGPYAITRAQWAQILAGKDFRLALQLLSLWVRADENLLDSGTMAFHDWKNRFRIWRENPSVKDYAARLPRGGDTPPPARAR